MKFGNCLTALIAGLFLPVGVISAQDLPQIRQTPEVPFTGEGRRIEKLWKSADRVTGFVNHRTAGVELCPSAAQFLYDGENLYISLRGNFRPEFRSDRNVKRSLFADNNFELFLKGEKSENYYQIAVSESGELYTGRGRGAAEIPGIRKYVFTEENAWIANLVIPLKVIEFTPEEQTIRFNIGRHNIDMPAGYEQQSSFAVLIGQNLDYHVPDTWSSAVMTAATGEPKTVYAGSDSLRTNLIADPGFDFLELKNANPELVRAETMYLSREWVLRATGKIYHFWTVTPSVPLRAGEEYTLKVRARRTGDEEQSLGSLLLVRENGQTREGLRPFWNLALSRDFQEYYTAFRAPGNVAALAFYRLDGKEGIGGVEVENISLFRGKVSPLEIRKFSRAGVKNVVPGTEIRLPQNPYGRFAGPLKVLVIGTKNTHCFDPAELFAGTGAAADMVVTTGKNSDTYYTLGEPDGILSRIEKGEYDLYMIGGRDAGTLIGPKMAEKIAANVKRGAGLFWNTASVPGHFAALLKEAELQDVKEDHFLRQALPVEFFSPPPAGRNGKNDPLTSFREGVYGKGCVVTGRTASTAPLSNLIFQMNASNDFMACEKFPWSGFNKAWLARLVRYVAGRNDVFLAEVEVKDGTARIKSIGIADGTKLAWTVTDKNGGTAASGEAALKDGTAEIRLPELTMSGNYVFSVRALNREGETIDYFAKTFSRPGPRIVFLRDVKRYHRDEDKAEVQVVTEGCTPGMTLDWALEDFSGRILERGGAAAEEPVSLSVPLEALYTNLGNAEITLREGGTVRDVKRIALIAQDRDRKRLLNDFTPAVWNYEIIPDGFAKGTDRQQEKIGFRSYLLAFHGAAELKTGMGTGMGWLCADVFWGGRPQTGNIRQRQFNTKAARHRIGEYVRKVAESARVLGPVHSLLCDEPRLIPHNSRSEFDEHPENIAEYRLRMAAKYGTIGEFNRRMGTAYGSFDQLKPARIAEARESGKFGEFIEWRNFNADRWCEGIRLVSDTAKEADPETRFSVGDSFGESALSGEDYYKLVTRTNLDFAHEYTSMVYQGNSPISDFDEFYRSFHPDIRMWGYTGYFFDRAKAFFQPWWFALHRYGGFTWYGTYAVLGGGYNLLDFTGAYTRDAANLEEGLKKSGLLNGLGKVFFEYRWAKNDTAIYYSHDSLILAFIRGTELRDREIDPGTPLHKLMYSRMNAHHLLEDLLYQYEFLAPEQILHGQLKDRKVLLMPCVCAMSDAEVKAVKDFMACGGCVIADFLPGEFDELGNKRETPPFTADEMVVLGTIFNDKDVDQKKKILSSLLRAGSNPLICVENAPDIPGREAMHFISGDMHIFAVLRNQTRSKDALTQTFTFPVSGHIYDLRTGKYLGEGNQVMEAVPNGDACVWGVYPYKVKTLRIQSPDTMQNCRDFVAELQIELEGAAAAGKHVIHAELIPPQGEARFFLQRNLTAENGKAEFRIRIAENDPAGEWTFRAVDVLTGVSAEKKIIKEEH